MFSDRVAKMQAAGARSKRGSFGTYQIIYDGAVIGSAKKLIHAWQRAVKKIYG